MKCKGLLILVLIVSLNAVTHAQRNTRIGYIDMDYILENVPEYADASSQLDTKVGKWKSEIEKKLDEITQMKQQLANERALLTPELVEERQEEIDFEEAQILEYQQKRFGPGGDLMIQKRQLIQPVQDQVFNAVQEISTNKKYDFVFDKSSDVIMLYAAERHDISDQVLRSITRASKRKQVNNKQERQELEEDESQSVEEDKEDAEAEAQKIAREAAVAEKAAVRKAEREAKQKEFEARRAKILEDRQRRKDSVAAARAQKSGGTVRLTPEERAKRRDSIVAARNRARDSIIAARKKKVNRPPSTPDGDDG